MHCIWKAFSKVDSVETRS